MAPQDLPIERGDILFLRADGFTRPEGQFEVVATRESYVKVRGRNGKVFKLSWSKLDRVWVRDEERSFAAEEGVLGASGYRVGESGLPLHKRRRLLKKVLASDGLPPVDGVEEWGAPMTPERLSKLAHCLAAFASIAERRTRPPRAAIADWRNDLDWLRDTYGDRISISWP